MTKFTIALNGVETDVEVSRQGQSLFVTYDGCAAEVELVHREGAAFLLEWVQPDGRRQRIRAAGAAGHGEQRQIWVNGRSLTYTRVRRRGIAAADESTLAAAIPAVVTEILVQPGDYVAEGDKLILLESMKMVIPIQAPYNGTVVGLTCQPGESVQAGVPLIEIEKEK